MTIYVVWDQLEVLEFSILLSVRCNNTAGNILLRTPHPALQEEDPRRVVEDPDRFDSSGQS